MIAECWENHEVFRLIVITVSITVVYYLISRKWSPNHLLRNDTMSEFAKNL